MQMVFFFYTKQFFHCSYTYICQCKFVCVDEYEAYIDECVCLSLCVRVCVSKCVGAQLNMADSVVGY